MLTKPAKQREPARTSLARGIGETNTGRKRRENQDAILVLETNALRLYAVADGIGGERGGANASRLAVSVIEDFARSQASWGPHTLEEAFLAAHHRIRAEASQNPNLARMGTTLVCLAFIGDEVYWANVGDSRCYFFRGSQAHQLTDDHTLAADLVRGGALTPQQAAPGPLSHMLTQSLGGEEGVVVDSWFSKSTFRAGDRFVLCSDGLHNLLSGEEIRKIVVGSGAASAAHMLVQSANERGGDDNISAIVIEAGPALSDAAVQPDPGFQPQRVQPLYPERTPVAAARPDAPLVEAGEELPGRPPPPSSFSLGILTGFALIFGIFLLGLWIGSLAPSLNAPLINGAAGVRR